jgi:hypothetical protein
MDVTPSSTPAAMAPTVVVSKGAKLSPTLLLGVLLVLAAVGVGIAVSVKPQPGLWWEAVAMLLAALGAWLIARPWAGPSVLLAAGAALILSGAGFGLAWPWLSWLALGVGIGCAVRWGYAQQKRSIWFTYAVIAVCYGVSAVGALVQAAQNRGLLWVFCQGLGSLLAGYALQRVGTRADSVRAWGLAARALIIAGIVLPYAALLLVVLRRAA